MAQQIKLYNNEGNETAEIPAPDFILSPWNASLVHQVYKAMAANRRKPIAHTKIRSEVRGGGIKPWRQKGTGRARQGSIRSPLWKGGGVTFGPRKDKDYSQKINKKMAKKALGASLNKKLELGELKAFSDLDFNKTNKLSKSIRNITNNSVLLVVSNENKKALRLAANIAKVDAIFIKNLNVYDVLNHKNVLIEQKALNQLSK